MKTISKTAAMLRHPTSPDPVDRQIRIPTMCVLFLVAILTLAGSSPFGALAQSSAPGKQQTAVQQYPDRAIRMIVAFPPGGGADYVARHLGQKLSDVWGKPVVIDNRAGAGGNIAAEIAAVAAPDGYTLLQSTMGHVVNTSLYDKPTYDLRRDFAAVTQLASAPYVLVVRNSLAAASVTELIALAKAKPDVLTYASSGTGGPAHLATELLNMAAKVKVRHIPYKGVAPSIPDLLAGRVDMMLSTIGPLLSLIHAGKMRALGVTSLKRTSTLPNLPTMDEIGLKNFEASAWYGVNVPVGTPRAIIATLHDELVRILRQPDTQERLVSQGFDLVGDTPEQFANYIRAEVSKWAGAVKEAGLRQY